MAPVDKFDAFVGNFVAMLQSYRIDDAWAKTYVQQGLARLRQLQQQTAAIVTRNAQEIHEMMQAAYDYVNFTGRNPRYNEDMTPINSRELWERHVR